MPPLLLSLTHDPFQFSLIFPLKAIIFQLLLLLIEIAIESHIFTVQFSKQLAFPPKKSVEYAISLTLLATVVGWLGFYCSFSLLKLPKIKFALINFILFNKYSLDTLVGLFFIAVLTFFLTLLVKFIGFSGLQAFLADHKVYQPDPSSKSNLSSYPHRRWFAFGNQMGKSFLAIATPYSTILLAHAFSYTAILVLVFIFNRYNV